jgi:hypothetical protein
MKLLLKTSAFILLLGTFYISCKKEKSCENCGTNKSPIANAGLDQVITLPTDSVSLDGSLSSDPDGKISEWLWTKISGPVSFNIIKPLDSITLVKTLVAGTYKFELKVKDNGGLSAKDTVQITVNDPAQSNRPPVANAGSDQIITLPTNTVNLDGNGSTDPDNNITSYAWTKISGPSSLNIINGNAVQTEVTNLALGVYQFELKVSDADGLFSKDTVQINVNPEPLPPPTCNPGNRPLINAQLVSVGTLSQSRAFMAVSSAGNKILFAGGWNSSSSGSTTSSRVDIYDKLANTWNTAELSQARSAIAASALGNKIYFAGGDLDGAYST